MYLINFNDFFCQINSLISTSTQIYFTSIFKPVQTSLILNCSCYLALWFLFLLVCPWLKLAHTCQKHLATLTCSTPCQTQLLEHTASGRWNWTQCTTEYQAPLLKFCAANLTKAVGEIQITGLFIHSLHPRIRYLTIPIKLYMQNWMSSEQEEK